MTTKESESYYVEDEAGINADKPSVQTPKELYEEFKKANDKAPRKELPRISSEDNHYSSTIVMLKKTRAEVDEFSKDLGAVNVIAELPVSSDVRRTVARMFADPRNAEAISEAEWRRREHQYQLEKEQFSEKMGEHIKKERTVVQKELQQLGK